MFSSVLSVLIIGPLRDLTACKSQAVEIAGRNIMETLESVWMHISLGILRTRGGELETNSESK